MFQINNLKIAREIIFLMLPLQSLKFVCEDNLLHRENMNEGSLCMVSLGIIIARVFSNLNCQFKLITLKWYFLSSFSSLTLFHCAFVISTPGSHLNYRFVLPC